MDKKEYLKIWKKNNPDKVKAMRKREYLKHRDDYFKRSKEWIAKHPEKRKIFYDRDNAKSKERKKKWYEQNKDKLKEYVKLRRDKIRETQRIKYKSDITYRINCIMHSQIHNVLIGQNFKWLNCIDYSLDDLKNHLESQFRPGMSWVNMGLWHIDHIIPQSKFNFTSIDDPQFEYCWSLQNLQPLWCWENKEKQDSLQFRRYC